MTGKGDILLPKRYSNLEPLIFICVRVGITYCIINKDLDLLRVEIDLGIDQKIGLMIGLDSFPTESNNYSCDVLLKS